MAINTAVLVAYLLGTFAIAIRAYQKTVTSDDYFLAGRKLGVIVSVGTFVATMYSSWSVIGAPGYFYQVGWAGYWQFGGTILTSVFAAMWFGAKIRSTGHTTLADLLAARYESSVVHMLAAAVILGGSVIFLTVQVMGAGVLINQITGINSDVCTVLSVIIFVIFTATGGMNSVAWTDLAQALLITIGVLGAVAIGLSQVGGFWEMNRILASDYPYFMDPFGEGQVGIMMIVNWYCVWGIGNLGTPQFMSRFLACKDENTVRLSQGITAVCFALFYLMIGTLGGLSKIFFPNITDVNTVGTTFITNMLPPLLGAIILSALVAAAMSTASSILLVAATSYIKDFHQVYSKKELADKELMNLSRVVTVVIALLSLIMAYADLSSIMWLQPNMVATMGACIGTPLVVAFAWKRANKQGAIASILGGIIVTMGWFILDLQTLTLLHPVIPGTLSAVILILAVSPHFAPPSEETIQLFFPEKTSKT